jgi:hypothetical protein
MDFIDILKNLGFEGDTQKAAYAKYQKSQFWKDIREKVLTRDDHRCQCCGDKDKLVVHHREYSYDVMSGENLDRSKIITLCNSCHGKIHFFKRKGKMIKRDHNKSEKKLSNMLRGYGISLSKYDALEGVTTERIKESEDEKQSYKKKRRKRRKKKTWQNIVKEPNSKTYPRLGECRRCGNREYVNAKEFNRVSSARCSNCQGILDKVYRK